MNSGIFALWKLLLVILFPINLSLFIPLPSAKIFSLLFITTFSKHILMKMNKTRSLVFQLYTQILDIEKLRN